MAQAVTSARKPTVSKSVRVDQDMWNAARAKAERSGTNINSVVGDLVEGYARGAIDLTVVKQFATPAPRKDGS